MSLTLIAQILSLIIVLGIIFGINILVRSFKNINTRLLTIENKIKHMPIDKE
ncbi:hypothetical protein SAMN05660649_00895 [Desulfotomaculum arcticum]|uniref:Uncharacterized protein n=1 Tax=Desulfotruncus arcticus DSM 17038 TaxID=1121424 RepID=A0A1I2PID4_9FIRM|nr:hypothetical protein SAMN05660649_00895 [Desulfotomaculum arcticum] [Desulfotruncus arcticus DSM 17038]